MSPYFKNKNALLPAMGPMCITHTTNMLSFFSFIWERNRAQLYDDKHIYCFSQIICKLLLNAEDLEENILLVYLHTKKSISKKCWMKKKSSLFTAVADCRQSPLPATGVVSNNWMYVAKPLQEVFIHSKKGERMEWRHTQYNREENCTTTLLLQALVSLHMEHDMKFPFI